MKPLPRKYEEGSLEPGFLAPAAICPRCKGSGLDPDCTKKEISKGVRLSKSPATKWYVTDYPEEGSFAITDGYEIFAQIIGGKTVGDECDLANRIAKLPDLERERDEARQQYDNLATEHMLAVNKFAEECDEARADAAKIADILSGLKLRSTDELARLEQERNEAREISKAASKGISKTARLNQFLLSELIAVRKERDELKEIASEFAMTASHCLGWHENKNPNQITSALSRWLKISTNELDA
jgi:hypothetical protein